MSVIRVTAWDGTAAPHRRGPATTPRESASCWCTSRQSGARRQRSSAVRRRCRLVWRRAVAGVGVQEREQAA